VGICLGLPASNPILRLDRCSFPIATMQQDSRKSLSRHASTLHLRFDTGITLATLRKCFLSTGESELSTKVSVF